VDVFFLCKFRKISYDIDIMVYSCIVLDEGMG